MAEGYNFDLCIVGAGLIGSAAARYAAQWGKICLVGPEEPKERSLNDQRDIYGSHYDEGRQTRCTFTDLVWSNLALKSISRYRELEKLTGISFYDEVGCLVIGDPTSEYLINTHAVAVADKIGSDYLTRQQLKRQFPYLNVSNSDEAVYENKNAGYISPRRLIKAQIKQARYGGCHVINEVVKNVSRVTKGGEYHMVITTDTNKVVYAKKVLLTTGAFTGFRSLLPSSLHLQTALYPLTVAKVEISTESYEKIRQMPCVIYFGSGANDWTKAFPREQDGAVKWYMLPPVKYPDGKYYIKLGHFHTAITRRLKTVQEVKQWYCVGGDQNLVDATADLIKDIVKGVDWVSYKGDWCIGTETPTEKPYIDMIHSQLGVAVGGNGYAAKSSDEIGRIAAVMMMKNEWDSSIPKDVFKVRFRSEMSKL